MFWATATTRECAAGFKGDNCAEDVDECSTDPCLNGATCVQDHAPHRTCPAGLGETCADDIDECLSNPASRRIYLRRVKCRLCHSIDGIHMLMPIRVRE